MLFVSVGVGGVEVGDVVVDNVGGGVDVSESVTVAVS
jgi:hypothetical protein